MMAAMAADDHRGGVATLPQLLSELEIVTNPSGDQWELFIAIPVEIVVVVVVVVAVVVPVATTTTTTTATTTATTTRSQIARSLLPR